MFYVEPICCRRTTRTCTRCHSHGRISPRCGAIPNGSVPQKNIGLLYTHACVQWDQKDRPIISEYYAMRDARQTTQIPICHSNGWWCGCVTNVFLYVNLIRVVYFVFHRPLVQQWRICLQLELHRGISVHEVIVTSWPSLLSLSDLQIETVACTHAKKGKDSTLQIYPLVRFGWFVPLLPFLATNVKTWMVAIICLCWLAVLCVR